MKARQSSKIREIGDALIAEGYLTLDEQAGALGLGRSTTWTILKGNHKTSGLSAGVINRMLAAPQPALVQAKILEYIDEKIASFYGHSNTQLRRFTARLSTAGQPDPPDGTRRKALATGEAIQRGPSQLFAFADEAARQRVGSRTSPRPAQAYERSGWINERRRVIRASDPCLIVTAGEMKAC
jgi:hypothetical protein